MRLHYEDVRCPQCDARRGRRCTTPAGAFTWSHRARKAYATRLNGISKSLH